MTIRVSSNAFFANRRVSAKSGLSTLFKERRYTFENSPSFPRQNPAGSFERIISLRSNLYPSTTKVPSPTA